ncbi:MAG: hypothetical protein V4598_09110 [Bdellovibrionota bacterium]
MKFLSIALLIAFVMPAHAAFVSLACSNATGTVVWEEGDNTNMARLTYEGFVTGVLDVERQQIQIERKEEVTLREQLLSQCGTASTMTTFAAKVVITPAADYPNALQSHFPNNVIVADVICEQIVSSQANCHP